MSTKALPYCIKSSFSNKSKLETWIISNLWKINKFSDTVCFACVVFSDLCTWIEKAIFDWLVWLKYWTQDLDYKNYALLTMLPGVKYDKEKKAGCY